MKHHNYIIAITMLVMGAAFYSGCESETVECILEGTVTFNGSPLQGISVKMTGTDGSYDQTTDNDGKYIFNVDFYGQFTIRPSLPDNMYEYIYKPYNRSIELNEQNAIVSGIDFELVNRYHTYSGIISEEGGPLEDVTVYLSKDGMRTFTTTDSNGEFLFEGLLNGAYTISPNLPGYMFSPATENIVISYQDQNNVVFEAIYTGNHFVWNGYYDTAEHGGSLNDLEGYTSVNGDLLIHNCEMEDLGSLEFLTSVGGDLEIIQNDHLSSLKALSDLTAVGGNLELRSLLSLVSLDGLNNLNKIGESLIISFNSGIENLSPLLNTTSIGNSIIIQHNSALSGVNGLDNITELEGQLYISSNYVLTDLEGLNNLSAIGGNLKIIFNNKLNDLSALYNIDHISGSVMIYQYPSSLYSFLISSDLIAHIGTKNIEGEITLIPIISPD